MSNDVFKHARKRGHSVVENALLDDFNLTGMAKYLLIQFCSHREGVWKVTMPDIIKRSKNGRDAHYTALKELINNQYVARVKVLENGKHKEQIYIYGQIKKDVAEMLEETLQELRVQGYIVRIEFGYPLPENPKVNIPNSESQYNIKHQIKNTNKENTNISIQDIVKFDDDRRSFPSLSEQHLNLIVNTLREATNDELTNRSFKSVLRKVIDKYNQGKISNFRDYFITALVNKIEELDLRRTKENAEKQLQEDRLNRNIILQSLSTHEYTGKIPFYNWLAS
ncbi:hypothetical protein [Bacillus mycoides]|uniref:hypothetical protein n=1 Tax=Bacillus mycoides TaxID=1405 RepID=UPI00355732CF